MKSSRETTRTNLYSLPARGVLAAIINNLKGQQELVVIVVLGASAILSALFLFACLRSMIPAEGIHNAAGVIVGADFVVFYSSTLLALGGNAASAYDQTILNVFQQDILGVEARNLPWRYPPIYFLFLLPFANLSYLGAFWSWSAVTITALMFVVQRITSSRYLPLLVPLCLPVAYAMAAGQNGVLTATVIGAGLFMLPRSAVIAGILFGLLAYKPQMAAVIPFCLLAGRYYRAFIYMAMTAVVLALISWFIFGTASWVAFLQGLASKTNSTFGTVLEVWERIPTVIITALQIFDSSRTAWIVQACVACLAITLAAWVWRTSTKPDARALALVAATPLASPQVLDYDMAILIIPIVFLASEAWKSRWTAGKFILLFSMWIAEPMLRVISGEIDLQLGPFLWAFLLGYSVILVKQEQGSRVAI